jgi:hypothetical protein
VRTSDHHVAFVPSLRVTPDVTSPFLDYHHPNQIILKPMNVIPSSGLSRVGLAWEMFFAHNTEVYVRVPGKQLKPLVHWPVQEEYDLSTNRVLQY